MPNKQTQKPLNDYARWSSLSFQMIGAILALVFLGHFSDKRFGLKRPYFTIAGAIVGSVTALYLLLREATKTK